MAEDAVVELKFAQPPAERAIPPELANAPSSGASSDARGEYTTRIVAWYIARTGGDFHPDGAAAGYRWRIEFYECLDDPQAYLERVERELGGT